MDRSTPEAVRRSLRDSVTTDPPVSDDTDALVQALWADWAREAGDDADAPLVLEVLLADWTTQVDALAAPARREALQRAVVDRRIRALGRETLALGRAALGLDGAAPRGPNAAELRRGRDLVARVVELAGQVRGLPPHPDVELLRRDLREASLEAVFAVEGGAMSRRLSRIAADQLPS